MSKPIVAADAVEAIAPSNPSDTGAASQDDAVSINLTPRCSPLCATCQTLLDECGEDLFGLYSRKLLIRGWAGVKSPVEDSYCRAHLSPEQQKVAEARAENMRRQRVKAGLPNSRRVVSVEADWNHDSTELGVPEQPLGESGIAGNTIQTVTGEAK